MRQVQTHIKTQEEVEICKHQRGTAHIHAVWRG